jgi:hypothetical protein
MPQLAHADAGIPMFVFIHHVLIFLIFPIVLIEYYVMKKLLKPAVNEEAISSVVVTSNLASTFGGIPIVVIAIFSLLVEHMWPFFAIQILTDVNFSRTI